MAQRDALRLELPAAETEPESAFEALVAANQRWLGHYARRHPSFGVEAAMLERSSLWMNAFFQKSRAVTPPASAAADALLKKHRLAVLERLRAASPSHSESEFSTTAVDPMAALMYASSVERCPESHLEYFLDEAAQLLESPAIKADASRSGFAGCIFRFLLQYSETDKRIRCLRILVLLVQDDHSATVRACQVAAQGRPWKPNMFILSLQKRHPDNETIRELAADLLQWFSIDMPIESPIQLDSLPSPGSPYGLDPQRARTADPVAVTRSPHKDNALMLPELVKGSPHRPPFSPTTTISALYIEAPSPYSSTRLPIARPPTSPVEQSRRAVIYSTPKLDAVDGERRRRCRTPYISDGRSESGAEAHDGGLDSLPGSPLPSPGGSNEQRKKVAISDKYSWNPECINSVSGFEWWWRSLPQNHASLEPTQKLKAVTKAAVRMHTRGELQKAIELYQLALSSDINGEVEFRLRINLACAYEAASEIERSVDEFRRAADLNPGDAYAKYKLGDVLAATGEFDEARQLYESILGVYPQAADALAALQRAEEDHKQKEVAERAALAAAKASRRSPTKDLDALAGADAKTEATPTPPSTSKSTKRAAAPRSTATRVQKSSDYSTETQTLASTVSVGTLTDPEGSVASGCLGEMLTVRCRDLRVDLRDCFSRMDPHHHGAVRREAFAGMLQILCGADLGALSDETQLAELNVSSEDWDTAEDSRVLLRYAGFLEAHTSKLQALPSIRTDTEAERVVSLLDELVCGEAGYISNTAGSGSEESAAVEERRDGPNEFDVGASQGGTDAVSGRADNTATATLDEHEQRSHSQEHLTERHEPAGSPSSQRTMLEGRAPSSSALAEAVHAERSVLGTIIDGYTSLSPRMDDKREKAREAQILKAEKARVLARKYMHCLKSLRDIAARARTHLGARRVARAFLVQVASDARALLAAQRSALRESSVGGADAAACVQEAAAVGRGRDALQPADGESAASGRVKATAASVYDEALRTACRRVHCARSVQQLQSLARQYASEHCRVPAGLAEGSGGRA